MSNLLNGCEKRELCSYELSDDLFTILELHVKDMNALRNAFYVSAEEGEYILKKCDMTVKRLQFINDSISFCRNKFPDMMVYKKNSKGEIYYEFNGSIYVLVEVFDGQESVYTDVENVLIATRAIANFHKSSIGIHKHFLRKKNSELIVNKLRFRMNDFNKICDMVCTKKYKTEFDSIFLDNKNRIDCYCRESIRSVDYLTLLNIYEDPDKYVLCHHDLAHHNILIKDGRGFLIDFDFCLIDVKIHDLCNFINKVVKEFVYDINIVDIIIREYCTINEITLGELKILYALLIFPNDIFGIFRDYYHNTKYWSEDSFISKINRKLMYMDERAGFVEELRARI